MQVSGSALKAQQQSIAKLHKDGEEQEHRKQTIDAYFRLRMAWERAVEEVLLREVILRFRKGVETQRLAGVVVDDDDYAQVNAGMTKCSNYAHDKALMGGIAVPIPMSFSPTSQRWKCGGRRLRSAVETAKKRKAAPTVSGAPAVAATPG